MTTHRYTAAKDALSFLRAAQVNQGDVEDSDLAQAFHSLKRYTEGIERAEREAEDAKVREFRESSLSAIASVLNEPNADDEDWAGLSGTGREGWRAHYRAARKFFKEEQ